jgi:hypothetical protein
MFTICSFNSPDLDGYQGTRENKRHDMFTICSFNSPDLDGYQGTRENKRH